MGGHGGHRDHSDVDRNAGPYWLAFCVIGMISTLTMYGLALEYATSGDRKLHELSFVFVTTSIYSITAFIARALVNEKVTEISKYEMLSLSMTSIASTFTSVLSLRYVIYPVQVLFKSCKPVPVMVLNTLRGRTYSMKKYVNVVIITTGVAMFMGGGTSTAKAGSMGGAGDASLWGAIMLCTSLVFDGITGSNEDKLMAKDHVGPFDLMYNIQLGKAVISFSVLLITNELGAFIDTLQHGGLSLVILGLTGALGQVFVFITISKFGALNCALIGLIRKMLSLVLSIVLYGHQLNGIQSVGLGLAIVAMVANFYEKGDGGKKSGGHGGHGEEGAGESAKSAPSGDNKQSKSAVAGGADTAEVSENVPLMIDEENGQGQGSSKGGGAAVELINLGPGPAAGAPAAGGATL